MDNDYKVIDSGKGKLRFELVNPAGITVATFSTKERANASLIATKDLQDRVTRPPLSKK